MQYGASDWRHIERADDDDTRPQRSLLHRAIQRHSTLAVALMWLFADDSAAASECEGHRGQICRNLRAVCPRDKRCVQSAAPPAHVDVDGERAPRLVQVIALAACAYVYI
jgi:hypothetical protein